LRRQQSSSPCLRPATRALLAPTRGPIEALHLTQELRHRFYATCDDYPDRYGLDVYQAVHLYAEAASAVGSAWDTEAVGRHIGRLRRR
jgi:hypothetical protein